MQWLIWYGKISILKYPNRIWHIGLWDKIVIRPAGAAPKAHFGSRFDDRKQDDFLYLHVNGQEFVVGVLTDGAEMWECSLQLTTKKQIHMKHCFTQACCWLGKRNLTCWWLGCPFLNSKMNRCANNYASDSLVSTKSLLIAHWMWNRERKNLLMGANLPHCSIRSKQPQSVWALSG